MLYYIILPLAKLALRIFFKKIYLHNADVLQGERPLILATNHPTAFLEPCILAAFQAQPLYFLVRGDYFKKPLYRMLLEALHMRPINRGVDSNFEERKQNIQLLESMYSFLNTNKKLMILAEGNASIEKRLRPIKKGVARLAFGVYDRYEREDLEIVPVSVNFDDATRPRLTAMIQFGQPIPIQDYLEDYHQHKAKAIRTLVRDVEVAMKAGIIHINDPADDELVEQLFQIDRNNYLIPRRPKCSSDNNRLMREKAISIVINELPPTPKEQLRQQLETYYTALRMEHITDAGLSSIAKGTSWRGLWYGSLALPACLGLILNYPPNWLAKYFANRIKRVQYALPVHWAILMFGVLFYYIFLLGILSWHLAWIGFALWLLFPVLGLLWIWWSEVWSDWRMARKASKLSAEKRTVLCQQRAIFLRFLNDLT